MAQFNMNTLQRQRPLQKTKPSLQIPPVSRKDHPNYFKKIRKLNKKITFIFSFLKAYFKLRGIAYLTGGHSGHWTIETLSIQARLWL